MRTPQASDRLSVAFRDAVEALAVTTGDGTIVLANAAWCAYGDHEGVGPRAQPGANYPQAIALAAGRGDDMAATAADALEAVFGGHADRAGLDYRRPCSPGTRWFRLRVERLPRSGYVLVNHREIAAPAESVALVIPRQWSAYRAG